MMGSTRVMPCCFITGMAAGTSAALANKKNVRLRQVDITELKDTLAAQGAFLPNRV